MILITMSDEKRQVHLINGGRVLLSNRQSSPRSRPKRVLICPDGLPDYDSVSTYLNAEEDIELLACSPDINPALAMVRPPDFDVIVTGFDPSQANGGHVARRILAMCLDAMTATVVIAVEDDSGPLDQMIGTGVRAILLRTDPIELIGYAVRTAAAGKTFISPAVITRLRRHIISAFDADSVNRSGPITLLTDREYQVLTLLARGLTPDRISAELHLSHATVRSHLHRAVKKLGMKTRFEAVALAYRLGLVRADQLILKSGSER